MYKLKLVLIFTSFLGIAVPRHARAGSFPASDKPRTVLFFVAQDMFREEALTAIRSELSHAGYSVVIAAAETTVATGMDRTVIRPDIAVAAAKPDSFAGFVLINGSGIDLYWNDSILHNRCREFAQAGKPVGAIGLATICLAHAGLLDGHKATIFPNRYAVRYLLEGGGRYVPNSVVTDRNIITAAETRDAHKFGQVIAAKLQKGK